MGRRPLEVEKLTPVKVITETLPDFNSGELTALQDLDTDVSLYPKATTQVMILRVMIRTKHVMLLVQIKKTITMIPPREKSEVDVDYSIKKPS